MMWLRWLPLIGTILSGDYSVSGPLHWGNGVSGALTVASGATKNWTGGELAAGGSLTVASNGVLNLAWSDDKLFSRPLTKGGTMTMSGGRRLIGYSAAASRLVNLPGG